MARKKKPSRLEQTKRYIAFLEKKVNSENFKKNVSAEEYQKAKDNLKRERFKLKVLEGD